MSLESSSPPATDQVAQSPTESELLIPKYDKATQLSIDDLDTQYPEWKQEHPESDPELLLFDFVRTVEERRLGSEQGVMPRLSTEGVEKAIDQIPDQVGSRFQAHGIAGKSGSSSTELDTLLKNCIDPDRTFYTTGLRYNPVAGAAIGADRPFTEGGLVLVGDLDARNVADDGIKYVVVGEQYLKCFDAMQSRYPDVKFVAWHDAPQHFCDLVNAAEGSEYKPKQIDYAQSYEIGINDDLPGGRTFASVALGTSTKVIPVDILDDDYDGDDVW